MLRVYGLFVSLLNRICPLSGANALWGLMLFWKYVPDLGLVRADDLRQVRDDVVRRVEVREGSLREVKNVPGLPIRPPPYSKRGIMSSWMAPG